MTTLDQLLDDVAAAVEALDLYVNDLPAEVTVDDLVLALHKASGSRGLRTAVSAVVTSIENAVAENLPGDRWDVETLDGPLAVERKWSAASTKWDTDACWSAVVSAAQESGYDPLLVLKDAAAVSYFRVKPLRQLGVDPDHYRTQEGGRWRIIIN